MRPLGEDANDLVRVRHVWAVCGGVQRAVGELWAECEARVASLRAAVPAPRAALGAAVRVDAPAPAGPEPWMHPDASSLQVRPHGDMHIR